MGENPVGGFLGLKAAVKKPIWVKATAGGARAPESNCRKEMEDLTAHRLVQKKKKSSQLSRAQQA